MKLRKIYIGFWIYILPLLFSCGKAPFFEEIEGISDESWSISDTVEFKVDVTDTVLPHNFYLHFRNTTGYPYQNMFAIIETTFPTGQSALDTVGYVLMSKEGDWYGNETGSLVDNKILYKQNARFPVAGTYKFKIIHAMREEILEGVADVGLAIEKTS